MRPSRLPHNPYDGFDLGDDPPAAVQEFLTLWAAAVERDRDYTTITAQAQEAERAHLAAREALVSAMQAGASKAETGKLENAITAATARAGEPWAERIEACRRNREAAIAAVESHRNEHKHDLTAVFIPAALAAQAALGQAVRGVAGTLERYAELEQRVQAVIAGTDWKPRYVMPSWQSPATELLDLSRRCEAAPVPLPSPLLEALQDQAVPA